MLCCAVLEGFDGLGIWVFFWYRGLDLTLGQIEARRVEKTAFRTPTKWNFAIGSWFRVSTLTLGQLPAGCPSALTLGVSRTAPRQGPVGRLGPLNRSAGDGHVGSHALDKLRRCDMWAIHSIWACTEPSELARSGLLSITLSFTRPYSSCTYDFKLIWRIQLIDAVWRSETELSNHRASAVA